MTMPPEVPCEECQGNGTVEWETQSGHITTTQCSRCMGTGTVPA
ncbi:hypothetical protein [Streptomyces chattanoogensis]|nr:hypothetical protein [Streptomyces chattanoogensis]